MKETSKFEKVWVSLFVIAAFFTVVSLNHISLSLIVANYTGAKQLTSDVVTREEYDSHVQKIEPPTLVSSPVHATFKIAGDFMFARGVHKKFNDNKLASLEKLGTDFFSGVDAAVVNLEGAISTEYNPAMARYGSYTFVFPRGVIDVLKAYGINTVSLANNHSLNNHWQGYRDTVYMLRENNIQAFGGPTGQYTTNVALIDTDGFNLIFIGVHTLYQTPDITALIEEYAGDPTNRIIIMPHWGVEYSFIHSDRQEQLAHAWVDAGADLIVGAHPHVIQDADVYNGVPIIYSLGNFLFDQTEATTKELGVQDGIVIRGEFNKDTLLLTLVPIKIDGYQPTVVTDKADKTSMLQVIYTEWADYLTKDSDIDTFRFISE